MILEIQGDLLETDCKLICHGVNCQGVMGSGVAEALATRFKGLKSAYMSHCDLLFGSGGSPSDLLGSVYIVQIEEDGPFIANCFTQQNYGSGHQVYVNYDALHHCVSALVMEMAAMGIKELAIPRIGCGLAGGNWERVKSIFEVYFNETSDLTLKVYSL